MTTTTRAMITSDSGFPNRCTLRYETDLGDVVERDFFAPLEGGYVRENWSQPRQVCERLSSGGATLVWNPKRDATLADLIRRERAAAMRRERSEARRLGY
jgi:hypothetical protein